MKTTDWTYGVEHELGDWDTRQGFGKFGRDREPNICNSNGVAGDPSLRDYPFGAEINSPPSETPEEQGSLFKEFLSDKEHVFVSHRVGMHVHIRIPGLKDNLKLLKKIQRNAADNVDVYSIIDPIPELPPKYLDYDKAYRKWRAYIKKSHYTRLSEGRLQNQLKAKTTEEFFRLEAPVDRGGKPMPHAQPRSAINLRQLLQTDTIEFRYFFQTLDPTVVVDSVKWCRDTLRVLIDGGRVMDLLPSNWTKCYKLPSVPKFELWRDKRWHATSRSKNKRAEALEATRKVLNGEFDHVSNADYPHLALGE